MNRTVLTSFTILCLLSTVFLMGLFFNIQTVKASGTIYIKADGSVEGTTNIVTVDNVTYTLNATINDSIVVERGNITIDGVGHTVNGLGTVEGFSLTNINNVTIKNLTIKGFNIGIYLFGSSDNTISGNNITNNYGYGIWLLLSSNYNSISGNNVTNNGGGTRLSESSYNDLSGNNITNNGSGIILEFSSNNILFENRITNGRHGILLFDSSDNDVFGNRITGNTYQGIRLSGSSNTQIFENIIARNKNTGIRIFDGFSNIIWRNNITNNDCGIDFYYYASLYNHITENNIEYNNVGISFWHGLNNTINFNNFINNIEQVIWTFGYANFWDNGVEGNYWSDYAGVDSDHDGIGESWYEIDENNTDHYPLMGMFNSFNTSLGEHVNVVSNSTVEQFRYFEENKTITMYSSNMTVNQTHGFCRVCIPHSLINATEGPIEVIINEGLTTVLNFNNTLYDNGTHRWIYFAYQHSTHKIDIIPEFQSLIILSLFIISTLLVVIVYKRKHQTRNKKREV